jgi:hypothetical protein
MLCHLFPWEWEEMGEEDRKDEGAEESAYYKQIPIILEQNNEKLILKVCDKEFDVTDFDPSSPYPEDGHPFSQMFDNDDEIDMVTLHIIDYIVLHLINNKDKEINKQLYIADAAICSDTDKDGMSLPYTGTGLMSCDFVDMIQTMLS